MTDLAIKNESGTYVATFGSVFDYTMAVQNPKDKRSEDNVRGWDFASRGDLWSSDWAGTPTNDTSIGGVCSIVNSGWLDGANKIARAIERLEAPFVRDVRRRQIWTDHGDNVCMDRIRAGNLDTAWRRTARASGLSPPRILLALDCIAFGSADQEEMFWRGAAACALAEALVSAGYQLQLVSAFRGANKSTGIVRVTVKPIGQPLDMASAAAALAMPAFFRVLGHSFGYAHFPASVIDGGGTWSAASASRTWPTSTRRHARSSSLKASARSSKRMSLSPNK